LVAPLNSKGKDFCCVLSNLWQFTLESLPKPIPLFTKRPFSLEKSGLDPVMKRFKLALNVGHILDRTCALL
jgi:hypothetical protein